MCLDGAISAPYGKSIIDLRASEEALWADIHPDCRNRIRKATRNGILATSGMQFLRPAYKIISHTLKQQPVHCISFRDFRRQALALGDNIIVFEALHDNFVQGCRVVPFGQHIAYTLYSGIIRIHAKGAVNLLRWEAIRHCPRMGVRYFNNTGLRISPPPRSKQ